MEALKEALLSGDILGWAILLLLVVLFFKLLKSAGKSLLILACILILLFVLYRFFPTVVAPLVDFFQQDRQDETS